MRVERDDCSREVHPYGFDDAYGKVGKANKLSQGKTKTKTTKKTQTNKKQTTIKTIKP